MFPFYETYLINKVINMILIKFSEFRWGKSDNLHSTQSIKRLFESNYSEEIIEKIQKFYFKEQDFENKTATLEKACHVSTFYLINNFYTFLLICPHYKNEQSQCSILNLFYILPYVFKLNYILGPD